MAAIGAALGPPMAGWYEDSDDNLILYALSFGLIVALIAAVIKFLLEILPFIAYSMDRAAYIKSMKYAIKKSPSYESFISDFYSETILERIVRAQKQ